MRNFKSKISKFFWGGSQLLPIPHPCGKGDTPPHTHPFVASFVASGHSPSPPSPFPEILDPPLRDWLTELTTVGAVSPYGFETEFTST